MIECECCLQASCGTGAEPVCVLPDDIIPFVGKHGITCGSCFEKLVGRAPRAGEQYVELVVLDVGGREQAARDEYFAIARKMVDEALRESDGRRQ